MCVSSRWNWKHVPKIKINQNRFQWMLHLDPIKNGKGRRWSSHLTPTTNYTWKIRFTVNIEPELLRFWEILQQSIQLFAIHRSFSITLQSFSMNEQTNINMYSVHTHTQPQHKNVSSCELVIYVCQYVEPWYVCVCLPACFAMPFGELEFLFASNLMSHFIFRCHKNIPTKWN